VHPVALRFAPTVHGTGDHGFVTELVRIARATGVAGYVGDGANRWPAVHRSDAARLVRLGLEKAPAGARLHAVAEEGVPTRLIAEAIGRAADVPAVSIAVEDAPAHFGWIGGFFGMDVSASSTGTQELLGWRAGGPTLVEDLDAGAYAHA
jgi:nucleoside-diphosphate-sugar epimerase